MYITYKYTLKCKKYANFGEHNGKNENGTNDGR